MNVIPLDLSEDFEPEWARVGLYRCDFRPHFDGDFYNLFTTIHPLYTKAATEQVFRSISIELAQWVLSHRKYFGPGDRFQLIVGWPLDVRATGRQVIKTGGDYNALQRLVDNSELVQARERWAESVFQNDEIG